MAIQNFIPTVWSETLLNQLDKKYIAVTNCNRAFDADVKEMGSRIKVCGVGNVDVKNYKKDTDMGAPQTLNDTCKDIDINQAKYFNFQIDDIDQAQSSPNIMGAAMKVAAEALANDADRYVLGLYPEANYNIMVDETTVDNILDTIISGRTTLYENNVSDPEDIIIEVSPKVAELILKAKLNVVSDNSELLEHGCIGRVAGCKVFVSNNVYKETDDSTNIVYHKCMMRTKRSIAFVEQISEIQAYRPEQRFADAVKGLYLYGASVMYENEIVVLEFGINN